MTEENKPAKKCRNVLDEAAKKCRLFTVKTEYLQLLKALKAACKFNQYGDLVSAPADTELAEVYESKKYHATSRESGGGYYTTTRSYDGPGLRVVQVEGWKKGYPVKKTYTLSTPEIRALAEKLQEAGDNVVVYAHNAEELQ